MNLKERLESYIDEVQGIEKQSRSEPKVDETNSEQTSEWSSVEGPTTKALHEVVQTADGPYAVGVGGNILARRDDKWKLQVESGPATKHNTLTALDVTSDGQRIWFAGSSGTLGMYDIETGCKYDYSAPEERTSTWEAIAVTGESGSERLRIANGSGEVLPIAMDDNGCPQYGEVTKPGSGSTISALDFGDSTAYAIDTSGNVFAENDSEWNRIGIQNAQVNFFDLHATEETLLIAAGDGRVYRYDRPCGNWTPVDAGSVALYSICQYKDETLAVGAGGHIYQRNSQNGWTMMSTPLETDLHSISLGEISVVVGAGGVILEK